MPHNFFKINYKSENDLIFFTKNPLGGNPSRGGFTVSLNNFRHGFGNKISDGHRPGKFPVLFYQ